MGPASRDSAEANSGLTGHGGDLFGPDSVDLKPEKGSQDKVKAIYKLEGDKLTICFALDGKDRPKEFATKDGSFTILMTWQKDKP